jgi:hypothetical protein
MYIHQRIIANVIDLFKKHPEYRDDKWGTIKRVWSSIKHELQIYDELASIKLAFDVDRAFRYVQQHFPELRGKTWLARQKQGGIHGDVSMLDKSESEKIKFIQKSLFEDEDF